MKNKTISYFFFFISILFFLYVFYRSQIIHAGEKNNYYLKYFIISFFLFFFSIISFKIKKHILNNILLISFSLTFSFYILEACLLLKKNWNVTKKDENYDERTLFQIYKELSISDKKLLVQINPAEFKEEKNQQIMPLSSFSDVRLINCNENGYWTINTNDRYGFNNPDKIWNENEIDILIIGDSFSHGWCVNLEDSISGILKNKFNKKILNLSQPANDPLLEYAILKEYFPKKKKIKNIMMFYYEGNDLKGLNSSLETMILRRYLEDENFKQNLILKKDIVEKKLFSKFEEAKLNEIKNLKLKRNKYVSFFILTEIRSSIQKITKKEKSKFAPNLYEFEKIISKINAFSNDKNINFIFVYIPDVKRYVIKNNKRNYFYKEVMGIISDLSVKNVDFVHEFKKLNSPAELYPYPYGNHFTKEGYLKVTNILAQKLNYE